MRTEHPHQKNGEEKKALQTYFALTSNIDIVLKESLAGNSKIGFEFSIFSNFLGENSLCISNIPLNTTIVFTLQVVEAVLHIDVEYPLLCQ